MDGSCDNIEEDSSIFLSNTSNESREEIKLFNYKKLANVDIIHKSINKTNNHPPASTEHIKCEKTEELSMESENFPDDHNLQYEIKSENKSFAIFFADDVKKENFPEESESLEENTVDSDSDNDSNTSATDSRDSTSGAAGSKNIVTDYCHVDMKEEDIVDDPISVDRPSTSGIEDDQNEEQDNTTDSQHTDIKGLYICIFCDHKYTKKSHFKAHISKLHSEHICYHDCLDQCYQKKHLITSILLQKKTFFCDLCKYKCKSKLSLQSHLMMHKGEKPFKCNYCDFKFTRKGSLIVHMSRHIGNNPFQCNLCDYRSAQKGNLMRHMTKHTGESPFRCELCDYKTAQKGNLLRHMTKHTGESPYQCNLCDCKFTQKGNLNIHMMTHTGDKPFQCNYCDYRTARKSYLIIHMRTHTGEKPFQCSLCDYTCVVKSKLTLHMMKHTGEKPFQCNFCEHKFTRKGSLIRHMWIHTGERPFQCSLCDYKCKQKVHLVGHMKVHI